ncbi:hypothetical protein EHF33_19790 (plasmid) [Deinococcus psychrotolerans]|uniref:Uncharacterized protein n=1 Tax=Deinococcus psychrotolerans TaxID=2489213 RepID=A0A3G8YKE3_9DEIO|nr:hypothetical protein [Deinococcus psychrotolerans]AZI45160.1 hypothetical protein EHF33_19790 [Deinococcus psychrotolerans]
MTEESLSVHQTIPKQDFCTVLPQAQSGIYMSENEAKAGHLAAPRRRIRVSKAEEGLATESSAPAALEAIQLASEYSSDDATRQKALQRLHSGWLTQNEVGLICCTSKGTVEKWFEHLKAVSFEATGLGQFIHSGAMLRATFVKRTDLEQFLAEEGWRILRNQQDDLDVIQALTDHARYPLLNQLFQWTQEQTRRKLPLLDLALELQLTLTELTFDLDREIDWADQDGLMRDESPHRSSLSAPTRVSSRLRQVDYGELVTLETWSEGRPFKLQTTRVLARRGKLEHLHAVIGLDGTVTTWLLPSWAEILSEPEMYTSITDFEILNTRLMRLLEGRELVETALEQGLLKSHTWGRGKFIEVRELTSDEKSNLTYLLEQQKMQVKILKIQQKRKIDRNQVANLEKQLNSLQGNDIDRYEPTDVGGDLPGLQRMVTLARMYAEGKTLEECGQWCDVTRERVRQILKQYERNLFIACSIEKRVQDCLHGMERNQTELNPYHVRLKRASTESVEFALINQILIERQFYGNSLEILYTPSVQVKPLQVNKSPSTEDLIDQICIAPPIDILRPATPLSIVSSSDNLPLPNIDQARNLKNLLDSVSSTFDRTIQISSWMTVTQEACELAYLLEKGHTENECAKLLCLNRFDIKHMMRRHQTKLYNISKWESRFTTALSTVSERSNLPDPIARILKHCETCESYALMNALFVEFEILQTTPEEFLKMIL